MDVVPYHTIVGAVCVRAAEVIADTGIPACASLAIGAKRSRTGYRATAAAIAHNPKPVEMFFIMGDFLWKVVIRSEKLHMTVRAIRRE